ncbi:MAG: hypothetical protein VX706_03975 [Bacteroidota bacterium]|nr:hypothetical protein [Bacteroidota bacterium]
MERAKLENVIEITIMRLILFENCYIKIMKKINYLGLVLILISNISFSQQKISPLVSSFKEYQSLKKETSYNMSWVSLGPVLNSARVESVQVDETKPGTMYVAFGSGNLWKTIDNGISWKPIFNDIPSIGIGDIAIAPSDKNIIYVGTGESLKKGRNFTMPGTGIYKSINGGETWNHLGLNDSWHIGEISINPSNPNIVFVSVMGHFWSKNNNRGVYRTTNGGKSWKKVLYVDEMTGANDIVISNSNPNIIYASLWENYPGISGRKSGIYKSIDNGETWNKMESGLPYGDKMGRIGLAVSHSNPDKVYALIDNLSKERNHAAEVYSTDNGGINWYRTHEKELLIFPGIGWYFADIYVNPLDDNEIYALGVRAAYSNDGGKSFKNLNGTVKRINPSQAKGLHLDHCELWINPINPKHIVLGNDGGIFVSYNKGNTWLHYNNIPTGEFYDIELTNESPYLIYGGTQDDATVYGPPKEWKNNSEDKWKYLWIDAWDGGDGCITQVDPSDNNTVYFSMQNGAIRRKNLKDGVSVSIKPKLPKNINDTLKYNFITPYFISEHNHSTLYHAGNYVFKSTDKGNNWEVISDKLTISKNSQKFESHSAGAIAESKLSKGLIYYGTDRGVFWYTKDDGKKWHENSENISNGYIRSIFPSQFEESRVYMAMTGINYDDLNNYLYVSENYGKNWQKIKGNLPNEPANVIIEDYKYENILYAGLYRGVYISLDRGKSWEIIGNNFPMSSVSDIEIHKETNDMVVSTHGRGIYKLNLDPIHNLISSNNIEDKDMILSTGEFVLPKFNDTHKEPLMHSYEKVPITFYLNSSKKYSLIIKQKNKEIWKINGIGEKGINQIRWDLIIEKNNSQKPYHIHFNKFISACDYNLILKTENLILEEKITINEFKNL